MTLGLLCLFVALPLLEIAVLVKLGQTIGFWPTLLVLILTGVVGMSIVNRQGFRAFNRAIAEVAAGKAPVAAVTDGMFLMLAGALLVAPGLITDAMGLALLVPNVRHWVARGWLRWMLKSAAVTVTTFDTRPGAAPDPEPRRPPPGARTGGDAGPVIDGEFERLDEKTVDPNRAPRRPPPG